jgi:hypothetical protein
LPLHLLHLLPLHLLLLHLLLLLLLHLLLLVEILLLLEHHIRLWLLIVPIRHERLCSLLLPVPRWRWIVGSANTKMCLVWMWLLWLVLVLVPLLPHFLEVLESHILDPCRVGQCTGGRTNSCLQARQTGLQRVRLVFIAPCAKARGRLHKTGIICKSVTVLNCVEATPFVPCKCWQVVQLSGPVALRYRKTAGGATA